MRIIYVGSLRHSGTCLQRMMAMGELGHDVIGVDTRPEEIKQEGKPILL